MEGSGTGYGGFLDPLLSSDPRLGIFQIAVFLFLPALVMGFLLEFIQTYTMQMVGQKIMF